MPNLLQIKSLRNAYAKSEFSNFNGRYSPNNLSERQIEFLLKHFNEPFDNSKINKYWSSFRPQTSEILHVLESQQKVDVVNLFIDITNFSTKCQDMTTGKLSSYLDDYYEKVIPIIYKHKGEVEKIIGDGIICIFGEPFISSKENYFSLAEEAAKEIIHTLRNTDKEVKIALHEGEVMYYKNKTENYPEYTMIGKPLTELFRLEGVSESNAINYYLDTRLKYGKEYAKDGTVYINKKLTSWKKSNEFSVTGLKGVDFLRRQFLSNLF